MNKATEKAPREIRISSRAQKGLQRKLRVFCILPDDACPSLSERIEMPHSANGMKVLGKSTRKRSAMLISSLLFFWILQITNYRLMTFYTLLKIPKDISFPPGSTPAKAHPFYTALPLLFPAIPPLCRPGFPE